MLSWRQHFAIWLLWLVHRTDYKVKDAQTKGLLDKEGKTVQMKVLWLGFQAFHGVVEASGNLSIAAFVAFLWNPEMLIDKLDKISEGTHAQLAGAFELDRNVWQMCYVPLLRMMVNFPYLAKCRLVVDAIRSFFADEFLAWKEIKMWLHKAKTLGFPFVCVVTVQNMCVVKFLWVLMLKRMPADSKLQAKRTRVVLNVELRPLTNNPYKVL